MTSNFVHLRVHTEYSLIDGIVRLKPLIAKAAAEKMPALAISDQCNLFAQVKFYRNAMNAGIKPLTTSDFYVLCGDEDDGHTLITLYAQNNTGYRNITELISRAYLEGQDRGHAFIRREWIKEYSEGVIALSGGRNGNVGRALLASHPELAETLLDGWMADFPGRFYIELQRTGREYEEDYLHLAVELADKKGCPVVATNEVCFMEPSDFEAHEVRVCIHDGVTYDDPRRERKYSEQQYFRTADEMQALFSDIPDAIENTLEIARRCTVNIQLGKYFLPDYPIPDGMTMDEFFIQISEEGLQARLEFLYDVNAPDFAEIRKPYDERLKFELDIIIQMGFPGYFLIVMDFIQWAKDNGVPVGPGRGSGAGSLVAYAQNITDLDPLEYDLLFERFLNPERVSMPDFDVDFCMDGRDRVISYVADTYGRDAVSQIITFGSMAAKAVVRDVARVQGKSYGLADRLSKMIPFEPGITLSRAHEEEEVLRDFLAGDEQGQEIWDMALQLEGITRNVGKHAGGVVIAPTKLTDFSPLYCDEEGKGLVTQFDKDDVESAGLVKFDFLGLRTLTIIDWALKIIESKKTDSTEPPLEILSIPLDDPDVFVLLQEARTTAVFQLESRGMKDLIKRLLPSTFEDIVALVALFRPGPLQSGMVDDFINRKHGRQEVVHPHPDLEPVLENTYGVILYQEQVMQIAQVLASYSLGQADMLRRAMGKKKPEEMAKQRVMFNEGGAKNGLDEELATYIFDLMEKFAGYGFNKSHSAAYALVSYQTAWLKHHYPAPFMAAVCSADMQNTDKVVILIEEIREMNLPIIPPNVNVGEFQFTVDDEGKVVYGLGAIKGLGEGPIDSILEARNEGGDFTNLFDFCNRVDPRKVNKRALEALVRCGAFDQWEVERSILMAALPEAVKAADQNAKNTSSGMEDLFGDVVPAETDDGDVYEDYRHIKPWPNKERLLGEKETLGLYLTGHPIDDYTAEIAKFTRHRIVDLIADKRKQLVAGMIVSMRSMKTKRGDNMAFLVLDDRSARIEVAVFSDCYEQSREKLKTDALVVVEGVVSFDEYSGGQKMRASRVLELIEARQTYVKGLRLKINHENANTGYIESLASIIEPYRFQRSQPDETGCPVVIQYLSDNAEGDVRLGENWQVLPTDELLHQLRVMDSTTDVTLEY